MPSTVLARQTVIHPHSVTRKPIEEIKVGDVLVEGVVIGTDTHYPRGTRSKAKPVVYLNFVHSTTIAEEQGTEMQVLARLETGMVRQIVEAMVDNGVLEKL